MDDQKEKRDELEEYYEGLFEHRREIQKIYDEPLMSGWEFLAFVILIIIILIINLRWG